MCGNNWGGPPREGAQLRMAVLARHDGPEDTGRSRLGGDRWQGAGSNYRRRARRARGDVTMCRAIFVRTGASHPGCPRRGRRRPNQAISIRWIPARDYGAALGAHGCGAFHADCDGQAGSHRRRGTVPATRLPRPPNNHLQYAFTWFGLGAALIAVFVSWAVQQKSGAPPVA